MFFTMTLHNACLDTLHISLRRVTACATPMTTYDNGSTQNTHAKQLKTKGRLADLGITSWQTSAHAAQTRINVSPLWLYGWTSSDGKWRKTRLTDLTGYHMLSPSCFFCLSVMFTTCIWFALRVQYILLGSLLKIIAAKLSGTKKLCIGVCERMANVSSAIRDPESISCARPSCRKFKENIFNHKRQGGTDKNCFAPTKLTST